MSIRFTPDERMLIRSRQGTIWTKGSFRPTPGVIVLRFARRSVVVAAVLLTTLAIAGPAMAADSPSTPATSSPAATPGPSGYACLDQEGGYAASGVCQLVVLKAVAVCRGNAPWLDYAVEPQGTPNTTVTLVWGDPSGPHSFTQANLPLTGSVLWPGAVVDSQNNATDWPGWRLVDGQWVQGDDWNWVRPTVPVTFQVDPAATVTVTYPLEGAPCADPPRTEVLAEGSTAVLAATGTSDAGPVMLVAVGVLLLGSLLLGLRVIVRRRAAR